MSRKLLFVASSYIHILHFHLPYLRAFQERGWEVHVGCASPEKGIPGADLTLNLPFVKKMSSPANFRTALLLRRQIRKERYDLVITHTSLAAFFTRMALWALPRRPKLINMVHGYLFDENCSPLKRRVMLAAELLTAPQTDLVLTMNEWDYALAKKHRLGKRVAKVPGIGVEFSKMKLAAPEEARTLRNSLGIPPGAFVLFCAAELSERKSQHVLISALSRLPEKAVLVLAGSGSEEASLRELAKEKQVSDRVLFPGYIKGLSAWYAMADVVVTASRIEGLPFNVMEAMYCRRPVVASRVKGHTDLIRDGESGFLVPYGDDKACAEAILKLMEEPAVGKRMAQRAAEDLHQYALEEVFPQVMDAYESVLRS